MSESHRPQMLDMFFPGIVNHVKDPEVPYQYLYDIRFNSEADIDHIHEAIISLCVWCRDNSSEKWYINRSAFEINASNVIFEFNFADDADLMAFKLWWA